MIIPDYSIISPGMDALAASQCRLFIKVSRQFLHYIVVYETNEVVALNYYHMATGSGKDTVEWLEELLEKDRLLKKDWAAVSIIYAMPEAELVPGVLPSEDSCARELLGAVHGNLKKGIVLTGHTEGVPAYAVYLVPADMHRMLSGHFPLATIVHYYDLWMQTKEGKEGVHAEFYPNELLIKIVREGELRLIQNYTYQTPEDAAYYLLALYTQYDLSPEELPLQISGMIVSESAIYSELLKYFRNIETTGSPASITVIPGFDDYPAHFFSPVLKLPACVS